MGGYKEHSILDMLKRKSIIIKYIVFIALIFVVTLMLFIETTKEKASQSIVYTENSEVDYRVYLKDNDFFQKGYLEKDNQYIASLIVLVIKNALTSTNASTATKHTFSTTLNTTINCCTISSP